MEPKFFKHRRPCDYLPDDPLTAIDESWGDTWAILVMDEVVMWFYISLSHDGSSYDELSERARFVEFYIDLLPFLEAMYFYNERKKSKDNSEYSSQHLNKDEMDDPLQIIRPFCSKYPLSYVRIELWDFFQAVQFYEGPLKENIQKYDTSSFHQHLLTLVEAFYLIVGAKQ